MGWGRSGVDGGAGNLVGGGRRWLKVGYNILERFCKNSPPKNLKSYYLGHYDFIEVVADRNMKIHCATPD